MRNKRLTMKGLGQGEVRRLISREEKPFILDDEREEPVTSLKTDEDEPSLALIDLDEGNHDPQELVFGGDVPLAGLTETGMPGYLD
jgi:hypothetical protein